jgi:hypothetical protein
MVECKTQTDFFVYVKAQADHRAKMHGTAQIGFSTMIQTWHETHINIPFFSKTVLAGEAPTEPGVSIFINAASDSPACLEPAEIPLNGPMVFSNKAKSIGIDIRGCGRNPIGMGFSSEKDEKSGRYKFAEASMHLTGSSAAKAHLLANHPENPHGVLISTAMPGYESQNYVRYIYSS